MLITRGKVFQERVSCSDLLALQNLVQPVSVIGRVFILEHAPLSSSQLSCCQLYNLGRRLDLDEVIQSDQISSFSRA